MLIFSAMLKSVLLLFSGNFLGKIVGLLREIIVAAIYGTTAPVGAFRMAQTTVLVPVNFFTADSLNAGFIPLYRRYKENNIKNAQSLFWLLKIMIIFLSAVISVGLYLFAPWCVSLIAPGFDLEEKELAVLFIKVMAVGVPFYLLGILYSYLSVANDRYFLVSIRPVIQSIGVIIGVILAYYYNNVVLFAWGFTGAYIFYFILAIRDLLKNDLFGLSLQSPRYILSDFWKIIKPLLVLPILLQGNIVVEKIISSFMGIEAVASVEYAKFITETGVVLLAVPLGLVGLSKLSTLDSDQTKKIILQIIPIIFILTIPVSAYLFSYSGLIVELVFQRGAFGEESALLTKSVLLGLSIGFWAQVSSYVMIKGLNAQLRNKEVVIFMAIVLVVNSLFNIFFYESLGIITIGLGVSISSLILFILTAWSFGILKKIMSELLWLFVGVIGYISMVSMIEFNGWSGFFVSAFMFILYWFSFVFFVPKLNKSINPLVKKLGYVNEK